MIVEEEVFVFQGKVDVLSKLVISGKLEWLCRGEFGPALSPEVLLLHALIGSDTILDD